MPDHRGDSLGLLARVDHEVAARVGGGQGEETGPYARVELGGLRLQSVRRLREPLAGGLRVHVQQDGHVRDESVGRPAVDAGDLGRGQVTAGALVGDGRVDVAVGDDDRAALQGGPYDGVDVLRAVGGVEQGLRAVGQSRRRHVEQDRPQALADRGRAGLAGEHDLVSLAPDPLGEGLGLGGLAGAVAALQGDEEAGGRGHRLGVVAAEQRVPQVVAERHSRAVVDLGQDQCGDRQQQGADQHQRERGTAVREHELAVLQAVRADQRRHQGGDQRAERHRDPDDRVQVLGRAGLAVVLGLLVEQGVPGVGGHARADAGEGDDQQHRGDVRDQAGGEQRDAGEGDGEGQQPAARQGRQQRGRRADADHDPAGQAEHQQPEGHRAAVQILGLEHGHGDGGGDRPGDGRAGDHEQRDRARTALVDAGARPGAAQPLERRPRARGADSGQLQGGQHGEGRGEQSGRDVRTECGLVLVEPGDAGAQQVVEQGRYDECGGGERDGHEARAQREPAQRVHVVGQRPDRGALGRRGRQQGGRRALAAHRPEALGDSGDEGGHQEHRQCVVRCPVDPQGGDDQQRGPQTVRADHRPAAVERAVLGGERGERAEQHRTEEQRRQDARPEDGRHRESHTPVTTAERALGDRRLEGEHDQDQQGEGVTDTRHELRTPQPLELRLAQQGADGTLAGVRDKGVVGGRLVARWLLGWRHAFSLSAATDNKPRPPGAAHTPTPK